MYTGFHQIYSQGLLNVHHEESVKWETPLSPSLFLILRIASLLISGEWYQSITQSPRWMVPIYYPQPHGIPMLTGFINSYTHALQGSDQMPAPLQSLLWLAQRDYGSLSLLIHPLLTHPLLTHRCPWSLPIGHNPHTLP